MPSAANVKIEKQVASENALPDSSTNSTPVRQMITLVEHKIRNLEKRKAKLETYRDLQNSGKELNSDQKTAVAKYNEVMHTLEFSREVYKQFLGIAVVSEKEAKKLAKKEAAAKNQAELARLREILLVQDALNQMGNETVRDDFLHGRNGAAQLSESDLKLLDDLYPAVTPKHEAGNPTAFTNEVQAAAEHLLAVVDGKPKEVFGGTYSQVKEILGKIHESGYFDQVPAFEGVTEEGKVYEGFVEGGEPQDVSGVDPALNHAPVVAQEPLQGPPQMETVIIESLPPQLEPQPNINADIFYQQQQQQQPPQQPPPVPQQQQPQPPAQQPQQPPAPQPQQPPQQHRYFEELLLIGQSNLCFFQESELDPAPEQIPTQTFTNQSFVGAPPPQMALPPMFQNIPTNLPPQQQQPPPPIPPTAVAAPPTATTVVQPQPVSVVSGNNGIDEPRNNKPTLPDDSVVPPHKPQSGVGNRNRTNNHNNPSYYQNNNGYNRPRQNRNGPRIGNRHNNNN